MPNTREDNRFPHSTAAPLQRELEVATRLARRAGKALLDYRAGPLDIGFKTGNEVVTPADREADRIIRAGLAQAFPADALFTEETADSPQRLTHERVWIVDPLDGTSDFIVGGDHYCVSIGLAIGGRAALGVIYNPSRDELYAGALGMGATLSGRPVRVSDAADLQCAQLTASPKELKRGTLGALAETLRPAPIASMAYKLARVAAGLDDGVFSLKRRKEWGSCAGTALVTAAGGAVRLLDGEAPRFNRGEAKQPCGMVAAGPRLLPALLAAVRAAATPRG